MSVVIERLKNGPSVCIDDFAADWAEQEGRTDYMTVPAKKAALLDELRIAFRNQKLPTFGSFRNAERSYRPEDAAELAAGSLRVIPSSVNAWLASEGMAQLEGLPASLLAAPAQTADTVPVPVVVVAEPLPAIKKDGYVLKKAAAIARYSTTWPTIEADFNHASENGLSEAAKATKHGDWYETALLAWADQRGKRGEPKQSREIVNSVFAIAGKKHTTKG